MKYTSIQENYLKAIYHLQKNTSMVSTNDLANALETKPASVTDMLRKLSELGLVSYEKYKGFCLSAEGEQVAIQIIRKHRLWEYFLVEKLQFGWDEVHEIAEELEHIESTTLIDRLDNFLGFPTTDPHGDPIPSARGEIRNEPWVLLKNIPEEEEFILRQVTDQSPEILDLLNYKNLVLGSRWKIIKKFQADDSIEMEDEANNAVHLSAQIAEKLQTERIVS